MRAATGKFRVSVQCVCVASKMPSRTIGTVTISPISQPAATAESARKISERTKAVIGMIARFMPSSVRKEAIPDVFMGPCLWRAGLLHGAGCRHYPGSERPCQTGPRVRGNRLERPRVPRTSPNGIASMSSTVSEVIVDTLVKAGAKRCYGIVGDTINHFTEALSRSPIDWVHVRHEEVGALAAGGEAYMTGELRCAPARPGRAACISSTASSRATATAPRCVFDRLADRPPRGRPRLPPGGRPAQPSTRSARSSANMSPIPSRRAASPRSPPRRR